MHEGGGPKASLEGQGFGGSLSQYQGQLPLDKRREAQSKPAGGSVSPGNDHPLPKRIIHRGRTEALDRAPQALTGQVAFRESTSTQQRGVPLMHTPPPTCTLQAQRPPPQKA